MKTIKNKIQWFLMKMLFFRTRKQRQSFQDYCERET